MKITLKLVSQVYRESQVFQSYIYIYKFSISKWLLLSVIKTKSALQIRKLFSIKANYFLSSLNLLLWVISSSYLLYIFYFIFLWNSTVSREISGNIFNFFFLKKTSLNNTHKLNSNQQKKKKRRKQSPNGPILTMGLLS